MQGSSEARCSSKSFWLCFSCLAKSTSNTEIRLLNVHSDMDEGNLKHASKVDVNGRSGSGDYPFLLRSHGVPSCSNLPGGTESFKRMSKCHQWAKCHQFVTKIYKSTRPCAQIWSILNTCRAFGGRYVVKSEGAAMEYTLSMFFNMCGVTVPVGCVYVYIYTHKITCIISSKEIKPGKTR